MFFEGVDPQDLCNIEQLNGSMHVGPKMDGKRYIMYKDETEVYLVDRGHNKSTRKDLVTYLPKTQCKTYVLDLEWVEKKRKLAFDGSPEYYHVFYILDILGCDELQLRNKPFTFRYNILQNLFADTDLIKIVPYTIWNVKNSLPSMTHGFEPNDGLVFVASDLPYKSLRLRYKYVDTIDFMALIGGFLGVSVGEGKIVPFRVGNRNVQCNDYMKVGKVHEMRYDLNAKKWKIVCVRHDKTKPNRLHVARFILYNVILKKRYIQPFAHDDDEKLAA